MGKRYVLKAVGNESSFYSRANRPFEQNLLNLSALDIKWNTSLIKNIRSTNDLNGGANYQMSGMGNGMIDPNDEFIKLYSNVAGHNDYIAYYDQTYKMRRDFLRKFALQAEIDYVLETIADETIVNDDMHYFAYPNLKKIKSLLKKDKGKEIVDGLNESYRKVYNAFHFNDGDDAWQLVKKFLIEGFLAFEIVYSDTENGKYAKEIKDFVSLDPVTMKPKIKKDENGKEYKVWVLNEGDKQNERELLDTNVIYISWAKNNYISHLSYCERLIRSFNMLRTLENSRIIWNMQNAQKRIKIVVPIGSESQQIASTRLRQLKAEYKEDINIDNMSGEITVNGQPKFSFAKNFIFPSKEGSVTEIGEIGVEGHDMNSTETLKWFWQRFIIETRLPKDRFNMFFDGQSSSIVPDNSNLTREEYRFSLFIGRIRNIIKELLLKPMWIQFCIDYPEFAANNVLKNAIGLNFIEENVFLLAKEAANLQMGATLISTLSGIQGIDGKPVFSMEFLLKKYLSLTEDDWNINNRMKKEEEERLKNNAEAQAGNTGGGGMDLSGGMDLGGGLGGGSDFGGGLSGGMDLSGGGAELGVGGEAPAGGEAPPNLEG